MTNRIKSLLMVFMLLFIGACADASKSDGVEASSSEFYLGEDLTIASIDGAVFTSDAVNPLEYNIDGTFSVEQDATALETAIATELEALVKTKLESNSGSEVTIGAYSIGGMVSDTSKLTVTIPSTITTIDGEKTESYVFNIEFGGDVPVWDGTVTEPVSQIATASSVPVGVYEIYSPSELAWIIEMSSYHDFTGETVILKRTIDMNSLPVSGLISFAGRFDGNRKEIRNLNIDYPTTDNIGFIRTMSSGGQIDNLTLTGVIKGRNNVGGFIGQANGSVRVIGIKNSINVIGSNYTGGIVGKAEKNSVLDISSSINRGYITGVNYTGGVVGSSHGVMKIGKSSNIGVITGTSQTGGFIGSSETRTTVGISNSTNRGVVNGSGNTGGFIGYVYDYVTLDIDNSSNSGAINGTSYTGGLLGYVLSYVTTDIDNSSNRGAITGTSGVGGLIGFMYSGVTTDINSSSNRGAINGTSYIGGLIGYANRGTLDINSSSNRGVIKSVSYTGGLIGRGYSVPTDIDNSSNIGAINATGDNTGGLIGSVEGQLASIYKSFNSGNIMGTKNVGGIIGYGSNGQYIKLRDVHSYALKITGTSHYVGGFIGFYYGVLTIEDSYWLHDARKKKGTVKASGNIVPRGDYKKLSIDEYKITTNFEGWDFNNSTGGWQLTNKKFPTLRNQPK